MKSNYFLKSVDAFMNRFPRVLKVGDETIGLEPEMLAVDVHGRAASYAKVKAVFDDFVASGAIPIFDDGTHAVVGVETSSEGVAFSVGTDVGHAIIETQLPPAKTLFEAEQLRGKVLRPIVKAFAKHGISLLGYGVLPLDKPHRDLRAPKGRYIFFERDSSNGTVPEVDGVDLHVFTMSAAAHTHIGIDQKRVIQASNMLNGLVGPFIVLAANSPVWKGALDVNGNRAVREWFWDAGWGIRRPRQTGVHPFMKDMDEYVAHLASFEPQMIKIGKQYVSLRGATPTIAELLRKGKARAQTVSGESLKVEIPSEYILFAGGFAWYGARPAWPGTVESRVSCQQPPDEPLAMSALALGLVANVDKAWALVTRKPYLYWQALRTEAMYQGFSHPDVIDLCEKMIAIAHEGLQMRGHGEEVYLESVKKRLKDRNAPADDIIKKFPKKGVEYILEKNTIHLQSLIM